MDIYTYVTIQLNGISQIEHTCVINTWIKKQNMTPVAPAGHLFPWQE